MGTAPWAKATVLNNAKKGRYDINLNFFPATQRVEALQKEIADLQIEFNENTYQINKIENEISGVEENEIQPIMDKWLDAIKRAGIEVDLN